MKRERRAPPRAAPRPRKAPRQERAQATVEAILEAAELVLDREGPGAASTTRIAEVAGVSVGSLYQYFAHRDAILMALQERQLDRAEALLRGGVAGEPPGRRPPREEVAALVRGLVALYAGAPGLYRMLAAEGPSAACAGRSWAFERGAVEALRLALAPLRTDHDMAAFVAFQAARATTLAALLDRPADLSPESVIAEVVELVLGYLARDRGAA